MKKLITVALILALLLPVASCADLPDISGLTFDELVALKDKINLAMWNSQEWQEVSVPPGLWRIGEDIPAGHWTMSFGPWHGYTTIWYFEQPNEFGKPFAPLTKYTNWSIASDDFHAFDQEYINSVNVNMQDGWYYYCETTIIFTPYTGKPDLGFK